jgi:hypothetical protein
MMRKGKISPTLFNCIGYMHQCLNHKFLDIPQKVCYNIDIRFNAFNR